jgi:hypothetical protein
MRTYLGGGNLSLARLMRGRGKKMAATNRVFFVSVW